MRRSIAAILVCFGLVTLATAASTSLHAQQQPAQPAASQPARTATTSPAAGAAPASGFYAWIASKQADYNQKLAQTIREIRTEPFAATILLALLSFAYGILHAAGPGHGKAVISSYVLANERTVRRGIALSFLAALFQALSAILLVGILVVVFQASGLTRKATEAWLESLSWGIVTLLGAWMLYGQVRKLIAARSADALGGEAHAHDHAHIHADAADHGHARAHHHHDHAPALAGADTHLHHHHHREHAPKGHVHHAHAHDHAHGHDHSECCGHAHMPDPRQLDGQWSWSKAIALAAAVGIRPCTGAVFVLGFALSQGLIWAGIFATFAMALGTAITVSTLAAIAVGSRELAARWGSGTESAWSWRVRTAAGLIGSFAVMAFGLTLFLGSLGPGSAF